VEECDHVRPGVWCLETSHSLGEGQWRLEESELTMFDGIPVDKLSAPVILGIAVLMVLFGLLVPRRTYKRMEKEAENWRLAFEASEKARLASDKQTAELLELAKTSNNVLQAMFGMTESGKRTGGNQWQSGGATRRPLRSRKTLWQVLRGS
jgi:hypothetical protein